MTRALDFRRVSARLVAGLVRRVGAARLDLAEDAAQEALLRALRLWPVRGDPDDPEAWLFTAAHRALLDRLRREKAAAARAVRGAPPAADAVAASAAAEAAVRDDPLRDDVLRLLFACCDPALPEAARVALALKECVGFGTAEIARAFRVAPEAVAQRLVRAKKLLRERGAWDAAPSAAALAARTEDVRRVLYALFDAGARAGYGPDDERAAPAREALRLAGELRRSPPGDDPATAALHAVLLFHAARLPARRGADGGLLSLAEQDRSRYDRGLVARAVAEFAASCRGDAETRWHVEASLASLHAAAPSFAATDWLAVVDRYERLLPLAPTPVVRINHAIAVGMATRPEAALTLLADDDARRDDDETAAERLAARAFFLARAGRLADSAAAWTAAASRTSDPESRAFFLARARAVATR